jgi:hypothetical protein
MIVRPKMGGSAILLPMAAAIALMCESYTFIRCADTVQLQ